MSSIYRDLLRQLNGAWSFERHAPLMASMRGTAVLTPISPLLSTYQEHGTLELAEGGSFQFNRNYRYAATPTSLDIFFDQDLPRLFQSVALFERDGAWTGSGYHRCVDDDYRSSYVFELPDGFVTTHEVTGPRKSYVLETRYRRQRG